ncbi:MAG: hypothetical protein ACR2QC_04400 [Gammaproteobacteria bacterium]
MGTKNKPGDYDCYANAEGDEPMFILLAREITAPDLIRSWVEARKAAGKDDSEAMYAEALACAAAMEKWRAANRS